MKKKIFIGLAILIILHFITWKIWGNQKLVLKGVDKIEHNERCKEQFSIMTYQEVYEGVTYNYMGKKAVLIDSTLFEPALDDSFKIASRAGIQELFEEMDSTDYYYLAQIIGVTKTYNPYLTKAEISCWAVGTDFEIDADAVYSWIFIDWVNVIEWDKLMEFKFKYIHKGSGFPADDQCFFCF